MASTAPVAARTRDAILVIDTSEGGARGMRAAFADVEGRVHTCPNVREALDALDALAPGVIVAALADDDAAAVAALRARAPETPIVAAPAAPTAAGAVAALRAGASEYVTTPAPADVAAAVARALAAAPAPRPGDALSGADRYGFTQLLSRSPRMLRVFDAIRAVAQTDATVLVIGETGTGRDLVARALHERSRRHDAPLLGVKCGAFSDTLLERELFGHEGGPGAGRAGLFEQADRGTLFLEELGAASPNVQVNLLRALEERRVRRVGGSAPVRVDVRVIAATNTDLEAAVADGRFRADLYYRLNVFPIVLPPLRERPEDIPLLLRHFLDDAAREFGLAAPAVAPDALARIAGYRWPGNVRQLRAMCDRWVIQCAGDALGADALPPELGGAPPAQAAPATPGIEVDDTLPLATIIARVTAELERVYLHKLLTRLGGHLQNTAAAAGITRRTLYTRMKELGLDARAYK